ncbi:hypothetical protein HanXRQr2_Chr06g0273891 [Helianthus annuus]|uniref:Uncharacterized protein n=1 Tax=Helianthus annuus TaxID=4232 RepID=A0A251SES9_HELAN|nr:hypothetical protein HanXRQr2_Chr06g0273891 [Helianthus annuus]KAJ0561568.1 hypothetical protein HanHA300_Chr06g0224461 [Helianthus annuus]KAJ0574633.1 hypothetical protein HanHA89_Chr06g0240421 [Helianthus annuus]KAJ0738963.1 hypothetical protein HanLR1_Chr06g0224321 [Helianthus annuus]KAJ0741832.1 hypothetical protein HanOQP8_Chr06g0232601 [Helianthus annuus]
MAVLKNRSWPFQLSMSAMAGTRLLQGSVMSTGKRDLETSVLVDEVTNGSAVGICKRIGAERKRDGYVDKSQEDSSRNSLTNTMDNMECEK